MRRVMLFVLLLIAPLLSGCAGLEPLFGVFDDYYSGGGATSNDRSYHRRQQIESWDSYNRYGSAP